MTHYKANFAPKIALYEPDIPQNTAAIIRTCACLGAQLEIIEPCGFNLNDTRFKRVIMDYINQSSIIRYGNLKELIKDWGLDEKFLIRNLTQRLALTMLLRQKIF